MTIQPSISILEILNTLLIYLNSSFAKNSRERKKLVIEWIVEIIYFFNSIEEPSYISWILTEWKKYEKVFNHAIKNTVYPLPDRINSGTEMLIGL